MKTVTVKPSDVQKKWYLVDAENKILGRLATKVARVLQGKNKPEYTPNMDLGDYVIVINAAKVRLTGNKVKGKTYYSHSGYPGGLKSINFEKLMQKKPTAPVEKAVKGMLPKGPLGRKMFKKLRVYAGSEHKHAAANVEVLEV